MARSRRPSSVAERACDTPRQKFDRSADPNDRLQTSANRLLRGPEQRECHAAPRRRESLTRVERWNFRTEFAIDFSKNRDPIPNAWRLATVDCATSATRGAAPAGGDRRHRRSARRTMPCGHRRHRLNIGIKRFDRARQPLGVVRAFNRHRAVTRNASQEVPEFTPLHTHPPEGTSTPGFGHRRRFRLVRPTAKIC